MIRQTRFYILFLLFLGLSVLQSLVNSVPTTDNNGIATSGKLLNLSFSDDNNNNDAFSSTSSSSPSSLLSSSSSSPSSSLCPENWILATSSHVEYGSHRKKYCVRVAKRKESWNSAVKRCRKANGFMLKLDAILNTDGGTLFDTLKKKGIRKVWTGIHEEHGTLVWDDLRPTMVRSYYGPSEQFGSNTRGWTFDQDSFSSSGPFCGALRFGDDGNSAEEATPNQSRESTWASRFSGALSRLSNRRVKRAAEPSAATPLLVPLKLDADDSLGNTHPTVGKAMEQFQQFLSTSGFQLTLPSPTEMLSHNTFHPIPKIRNRRMLTTPKVTTTTDQSNVDDDDYQVPTTTPSHRQTIDSTLSPLDQLLAMLSKGPKEPKTSSNTTDSPSAAATNIDQFLDNLLQTALREHNSGLVDNAKNNNTQTLENTTPKSTNKNISNMETTTSSGSINSNLYLLNLLNQATVTTNPSKSAKEEKALDILSQLLASAIEHDDQKVNVSMKTSTSKPRDQKQFNSMIPSSLNPKNFVFDSSSTDPQFTSDQSISSSASTETKNKNSIGSFSSQIDFSASTSPPKTEKREDKKLAIRQGLKEMIRDSSSSFLGNLLSNINFSDIFSGVTISPPTSTSTASPTQIASVTEPSPPNFFNNRRRFLPGLSTDNANDLFSKYRRSDSEKLDTKNDILDTSTDSSILTTSSPSTTSSAEPDVNSSEEEENANSTTTSAPDTTSYSEIGGEDSGEDVINDIFTTSTAPSTTTETKKHDDVHLPEFSEGRYQPPVREASTPSYDSNSEITESPHANIDISQDLSNSVASNESKISYEEIVIGGNSVNIDVNGKFTKKDKDIKITNATSDVTDSNNISDEKANIDAKDMESLTDQNSKIDSISVGGKSVESNLDLGSKENISDSGSNNDRSSTTTPVDEYSRVNLISEEITGSDGMGKLIDPLIDGSEDIQTLISKGGYDRVNAQGEGQNDLYSSKENLVAGDSPGGSSKEEFITGTAQEVVSPAETVTLERCDDERMKSVCMTEPIEDLSQVGHCDRNWFGHRLLDRCYRPLKTPLTELEARQRCLRYGATLAMADTNFYGNVTALVLNQATMGKRGGQRAWVDTSLNIEVSLDGQCSVVQEGQLYKANCRDRFPLICQKDARNYVNRYLDLDKSGKSPIYLHNTTSYHPQTLLCPLHMATFDDVIVWYKDGRPIAEDDVNSKPQFGQDRTALSSHLQLDLSILLRIGRGIVNIPKPAMLQGEYWCELWRRDPFRRDISSSIHLRFTDVITLHGAIHTGKPFSDVTTVLANQMGQLTGRAELIDRHLTVINKNVTHFLRINHPEVRDIISFITDIREGRLDFHIYICLVGSDVSLNARSRVMLDYTSALRGALKIGKEDVIQQWQVTGPVEDAVTITLPDMCPEKQLVDKKTGLVATFPATRVNAGSLSLEVCDGVYSGTAWCRGNLQTGAFWDSWHITGSCGDKVSHKKVIVASSEERDRDSSISIDDESGGKEKSSKEEDEDVGESVSMEGVVEVNGGYVLQERPNSALLALDEVEIEEDNLDDVSEKLAEVLEQDDDLSDLDIETVADVVDKIVAVNNPSFQISNRLLETVDKVLDAAPENLKRAEEDTRAPTSWKRDIPDKG